MNERNTYRPPTSYFDTFSRRSLPRLRIWVHFLLGRPKTQRRTQTPDEEYGGRGGGGRGGGVERSRAPFGDPALKNTRNRMSGSNLPPKVRSPWPKPYTSTIHIPRIAHTYGNDLPWFPSAGWHMMAVQRMPRAMWMALVTAPSVPTAASIKMRMGGGPDFVPLHLCSPGTYIVGSQYTEQQTPTIQDCNQLAHDLGHACFAYGNQAGDTDGTHTSDGSRANDCIMTTDCNFFFANQLAPVQVERLRDDGPSCCCC